MNEFKKLRKADRKAAIEAGILRKVAKQTRFTPATVSRTFAGRFDTPNVKIVAALNAALVELGLAQTEVCDESVHTQ